MLASFVYGGWNLVAGSAVVQFETIKILTLPAFHWTSVFYRPRSPRYGHSCNQVSGSQILSVGGLDATDTTSPANVSGFNLPDPFLQGLAIFDLTTLQFASQYTANAPPYQQSTVIRDFYAHSRQYVTFEGVRELGTKSLTKSRVTPNR